MCARKGVLPVCVRHMRRRIHSCHRRRRIYAFARKGVLPVCVSKPNSVLEALWRRRRRMRSTVGTGEEDLFMGVDDLRRAMVAIEKKEAHI